VKKQKTSSRQRSQTWDTASSTDRGPSGRKQWTGKKIKRLLSGQVMGWKKEDRIRDEDVAHCRQDRLSTRESPIMLSTPGKPRRKLHCTFFTWGGAWGSGGRSDRPLFKGREEEAKSETNPARVNRGANSTPKVMKKALRKKRLPTRAPPGKGGFQLA